MRSLALIASIFLLSFACSTDQGTAKNSAEVSGSPEKNCSYAQGFRIEDKGTHRELIMTETAQDAEFVRYFLVDRQGDVPDGLDSNFVIRTPIKRAVCASTTHASYFSILEWVDAICGMSYSKDVMDPAVSEAVSVGLISDVTGANDVDIEKVIELKPDLVIIYPSMAGITEELWAADIPVMMFVEHSEPHPLGRSEWLKVIGELVGASSEAQTIQESICARYDSIKMQVAYSSYRPQVFFGSAWKGVWEAPGGRSASAQLLRDAGSEYVFSNNESVRGMQVDFEVLLDVGYNADFWGMIAGGDPAGSIAEMERNDPRMLILKPVQEKKVFYCNSQEVDYFGRAMLEPDVLLADLVELMNPNILEHEPVYFRMIPQ